MPKEEDKESNAVSYYFVLGVGKQASYSEIRTAYRKLALQWHPDRRASNPSPARFQQIQEAYSVLSDKQKRSLYDSGFYDPNDEQDQGFCDFMEEMMGMMESVDEPDSMEDLQKMLLEMAGDSGCDPTTRKRPRGAAVKGSSARKRKDCSETKR